MYNVPSYLKLFFVLSIILFLSWVSSTFDKRIDLTDDHRFTLRDDIKRLVRASDKPILLTVLFEGNLPPSFKNYRSYIAYYLSELDRYDPDIEVVYQDISESPIEEANTIRQLLNERGLSPLSRTATSTDEVNKSLIYPFIGVSTEEKISFIDLLDAKKPDQTEEDAINSAMQSFPDKLFNALNKALVSTRKTIAVIGDHSRLVSEALNRENLQLENYRFAPINGETWLSLPDSIHIDGFIAIAQGDALNRVDYLAIDYALTHDVPGILFIDKILVNIDSLNGRDGFLAQAKEYLIEDQLFKMGIRINPDLVSSLQCSKVPQVTGERGGQSEVAALPMSYHVVLTPPTSSVPITDLIQLYFPSSIDTLQHSADIIIEEILSTSPLSRSQKTPLNIQLNQLRVNLKPDDFNDPSRRIGVLIHGLIPSLFTNRLTREDEELLAKKTNNSLSSHGSLAVLSNARMILPNRDSKGAYYPIGYNVLDDQMYAGNVELLTGLLDRLVLKTSSHNAIASDTAYSPVDKSKLSKNKWTYAFYLLVAWLMSIILVSLIRYARHRIYTRPLGL